MEKVNSQRATPELKTRVAEIEERVNIFLSLTGRDDFVGTPEQRKDYADVLEKVREDVNRQLPPLHAVAIVNELNEAVAAKHYDVIREIVEERQVTRELLLTIRQAPVSLSPAQKTLDKLRQDALQAQIEARTADVSHQLELREKAIQLARIATSYAADTPVAKAGLKEMDGEAYTLQKLYETHKNSPKSGEAREDIARIVSDAYGPNYALKDPISLATKARTAAASLMTAAVLSTLVPGNAHAAEIRTTEVLPGNPEAGRDRQDVSVKVTVPAKNEKPVAQSAEADTKEQLPEQKTVTPQQIPTKPDTVPNATNKANSTQSELAVPVAEKQIPPAGDAKDSASSVKTTNSTDELVFKIPAMSTKEDAPKDTVVVTDKPPAEKIADDQQAQPDAVKSPAANDTEVLVTDPLVKDEIKNADVTLEEIKNDVDGLQFVVPSESDQATPEATTVARPDQVAEPVPDVVVETILDEPTLSVQLPAEQDTAVANEDQVNITIIDEEGGLSFSLDQDAEAPGVEAVEIPEGFEIIPIPTAPAPKAEKPAPKSQAPAKPKAPHTEKNAAEPKSDFGKAAQRMIERGGIWERRGIAMKFFIEDPELAMTPSQAAGLVGNLLGEAGPEMNPGQSQLGGPAFGIAQWEGPRLLDLGAFAGKNQADFMTQLKFIKYELLGKERYAFDMIKTTTNRKDAAIMVRKMYERPGIPHEEKRIAYANEVGDAFNKEYQAVLASKLPSRAKTESAPINSGNILAGWPTTGEKAMELFNQCDPRWGNILSPNGLKACLNACGPTNIAMAVQLLRPDLNITPKETIEFANANKMWFTPAGRAPDSGGVTFDGMLQLAKNWGVNGNQMGEGAIKRFGAYKEILEDGGVIIAAGSGPFPFVTPDVGAHFVMIRGITKDGKFLVADPYPKTPNTNTVAWDAQQIMDSTFGAVVLYK